jgi:pimeloyl-ACP methyl ester carboxylesterase
MNYSFVFKRDLSDDNLQYLSSEQGLADLATFRQFIHTGFNLTDDNKWISFGGSYPGSLSAWFRLKYPHLVHGAVSSSAPMLALIDFTDYMVVVNNSLTTYNPQCPIEIQKATQKVQALIQTQDGRATLSKLFRYA